MYLYQLFYLGSKSIFFLIRKKFIATKGKTRKKKREDEESSPAKV